MVKETTADLLLEIACETGEGPVWDAHSARLWWTDIPGKRLYRLDPQNGALESWDTPGRVGSFALRQAGGLVVAMEHGFALFDPLTGAMDVLAEPEHDKPDHRFNDGRCDREGRFLAGSMNLARNGPSARLWQLDPGHGVRPLVEGLTISNGLAFTADGRGMYLVDGGMRQIFRFDYGDDGMPRNQRVFQPEGTAPGRPDGGAVDADGCYWSARWAGGCVARFTPNGQLDRLIRLPVSQVTMCAFGGSDLGILFITTACEGMGPRERAAEPLAGSVFACRPGVRGLPEPHFAG